MTTSVRKQASRIGGIATALAAVVSITGMAAAATFTGTATEANFCVTQPQFCDDTTEHKGGGSFDLSLAVPTTLTGDATFTLSAFGDFTEANTSFAEFFDVSVEGLSLGRFLDSNPVNDLFDNAAFGDVGNDFESVLSASAMIPAASFAAMIADGILTATFTTLDGFNDVNDNTLIAGAEALEEFISFTLTAEDAVLPPPLPPAIPAPASLPLLLGGVAALGGLRRCRG